MGPSSSDDRRSNGDDPNIVNLRGEGFEVGRVTGQDRPARLGDGDDEGHRLLKLVARRAVTHARPTAVSIDSVEV